jgi:plasmid stabilization system protein ParE
VKFEVRLSHKAERDVAHVLAWYRAQRATAAGGRWLSRLLGRIRRLESNPDRCPLAAESEELGVEVRELYVGKRSGQHRILFKLRGRTVNVLRIWHSARDAVSRDDL